MKLNLIFLVAGLCLVAVSADTELISSIENDLDDIDYEYIANDYAGEVTEPDEFVAWGTIYFVIRKALSVIRGVKCTVKEVDDVQEASQTFLDDIKQCEGNVSAKVQKLITTCENIINTSNNITQINDNICHSPSYTTETGIEPATILKTKTPFKCFFKLLGKTLKLKNQIRRGISLIKVINKLPGQDVCVTSAVKDLGSVFNQFPASVQYCSKLFH